MKRHAASLFVPALLLAACGGGSSSSPPPPAAGSLQLTNSSTHTIDQVFVSPTTSPTWGPQQNSLPISAGGTWTLNGIPAGAYDRRAVSVGLDSNYYADAWNFTIVGGQTLPQSVGDGSFSGTVAVYNGNATYSITELYLVPNGYPSWGPNLLGSSISPLATRQVRGVPPGSWDVRCVHSDLHTQSYTGFAVASFAVTTVTCN